MSPLPTSPQQPFILQEKFRSSTEKLKNERLYRSCEFCYWKECFRIWMSDLPRFPKNGHQGKLEKYEPFGNALIGNYFCFQILFSKTNSYPVIARCITVLSVCLTGQKLNLDWRVLARPADKRSILSNAWDYQFMNSNAFQIL